MVDRIAILGPLQQAVISATHESVNVKPFLDRLPKVHVPNLWYASILQAGVNKLEIPMYPEDPIEGFFDDVAPTSKYLKNRVRCTRIEDLVFITSFVSMAFGQDVTDVSEDVEVDAAYATIILFLTELLLALRMKRNIVSVRPLPTYEYVEPSIPIDLSLPIKNLLAMLQPTSLRVASSVKECNYTNIKLFDDLIISSAYKQYMDSHAVLDENIIDPDKAVNIIYKASRELASKFPSLVTIKESIANVLPVTTKLIDVVFGQLPAKVADAFVKLLQYWLKNEKRIVIYEFQNLSKITMEKRMGDYQRKFALERK